MAKIPKAITDMSTLARVIFDPDTIAPSIPTGIVATPVSSSRIDVTWAASTDTGGSGVSGYLVYRNTVQIASTNQVIYSDTGLSPNTAYQYQVAAFDGAGNVSSLSVIASGTTQAVQGPPVFAPVQPAMAFIGIAGVRTYTDPTQQVAIGRYSLFVMGPSWEGWASSGRDLDTIVKAIKSASVAPGGTVLFAYQNLNAVEEDANDPCPTYTAEIAARNWRVYLNGSSGPLATPNTPGISLVNCTDFVPVNPSLEHPYDFGAKYSYYKYLTKPKSDARFTGLNPGLASSSLDGVYQDNFVLNSQVNGDWNRDGVTDGQGWPSAPTPWLAAGQLRYVNTMRSLAPTKYVFANAGDYGVTSAGVMVGKLDGMLCESYMGKYWSWETSQSFTTVLQYYYNALASAANPRMVVFGGTYPDTNPDGSALVRLPTSGGFPPQNTQWQWARYIAATAYLGEGMPAINRYSQGYSSDLTALDWYDFFGGVNGLARGWLGAPINALRPTTPKIAKGSIGIFGVEYTNGIVLVNPKGNGTQTVVAADIPGNWKFLTGTQDPTRDSGANFVSIALPERDGLILQRTGVSFGLPVIFQDDFATGNLTHVDSTTGVKWASSANTSVLSQNPYPGKSFSLRYVFAGNASPGQATAEQRFDLVNPYTELQFDYDLYFPNGSEGFGSAAYTVRANGTSTNNKFLRVWRGVRTDGNDGYNTFYTKWGGSLDRSASGAARMYNEYGKNLGGVGEFGANTGTEPDAGNTDPFIRNSDLGTWVHITVHIKCASAANNDGVLTVYRNGVIMNNATNLPQYPSGGAAQNGCDFGYILGFADSGFTSTTYVYLANVVIRGK